MAVASYSCNNSSALALLSGTFCFIRILSLRVPVADHRPNHCSTPRVLAVARTSIVRLQQAQKLRYSLPYVTFSGMMVYVSSSRRCCTKTRQNGKPTNL